MMSDFKLMPLLAALSFFSASLSAETVEPPALVLEVKSFRVEGDNPLSESETQSLLRPYLGRHVGIEGLQAAADALEQSIRVHGNAFHRVVLPPQETIGDIRLKIVVFRVAAVEIQGNKRFSKEGVLASLPSLRIDEIPDNANLTREIALANEHPAKQISVFMRQADTPDSLVADVRVSEESPHSAFVALNNSGTGGETGRWRTAFGVQKNNLFDADHALTISYTTSPEHPGNVRQWGAFYRAPLYSLHSAVSAYASDSTVRSGSLASTIPGSPFEISGQGRFYGLKLEHKLQALDGWGQQIDVGVDDKLFVNDTRFNGSKIGIDVRSRPLSLRYEGQQMLPGFSLRAGTEYAYNLGSGANNTETAYRGNNPFATRNWSLWRSNIDVAKDLLAGWSVRGRLKGQTTSHSLIAGEMFGIGGAQSVRGFEEREATGDGGWLANVELISPLYMGRLRWLIFYDQGAVFTNKVQIGQQRERSAASTGLGLRIQMDKDLQVAIDVAQVLDPLGASEITNRKGFGKLHFSAVAAF